MQLKEHPSVHLVRLGGLDPLEGAKAVADPSPTTLSSPLREFLASHRERAVVYLDALEYLTTRAEFLTVLRFVQWLCDEVRDRKALLIVNADPLAFDSRTRQLLTAEFDLPWSVPGQPR